MNKKKVLIFLFSLGGGGIQRFLYNLVNHMSKERFDITLVLVNKRGIYLKKLPQEVKVIDLHAKRIYFSLIPLISCLKKEKPDILFSIDTTINIVAILAKILSKSNCKLIIRQAVEINKHSTANITLLLAKLLYPKVDKCVVLTNTMKNNIMKSIAISDEKVNVIYNSINIKDIVTSKKEKIEEDEFNNIREPIIISVGRLSKQKNHLMLIDAFQTVLKETKAKLVIVGDGEERDRIEKKIKENKMGNDVIMLGFKSNPYKYIYNSDIFVLPSIYEGLSNALLEAIACDIPIVTTDNPDKIIWDGINGLEAAVTVDGIANKLIQLLNDKLLRETIISNNQKYMKKYNVSSMVSSYEKLFTN